MKISEDAFSEQFRAALNAATLRAPHKPAADQDQIELHFHGVNDCTFADASAKLFIGDDEFFRIIDVAVHPKRVGWYFVRPSGHEPGSWGETASHSEFRPFNVMIPE